MADELTRTNGGAEMFSVRETPWHKEGVILLQPPSLKAALARAGLDFEVEKQPTFRTRPDGTLVDNEQAFVIVRTDREIELGNVGWAYVPLQNRDAFAALDPLIDRGLVTLETGGSLRRGADVWLLGRFDLRQLGRTAREVFGAELVPFLLFTNNHSGRRPAAIALTPIRVVCANTLGAAESLMDSSGRAVRVQHTETARWRIIEAANELLASITGRYDVLAEQYRDLKNCVLAYGEFERLVLDIAAPAPRSLPDWNTDATLADAVLYRSRRQREEIHRLWAAGTGHSGDHTAWEAYNAVVECVDHNAELFPVPGGVYRIDSLLYGPLGEIKQAVLAALTAHARASRGDRAKKRQPRCPESTMVLV